MSRRFWYVLTLVLSGLWAVAMWVGYQLLLLAGGVLDQGSVWWAAYPEVQAVLLWLSNIAQGLSGVLRVLVIALWAFGQVCLLAVLWLGLRFGASASFDALSQRVRQHVKTLAAPQRDARL